MADRDKILDQFFGDATTPIEWKDEEEKEAALLARRPALPAADLADVVRHRRLVADMRLHVPPLRRAVRQGLGGQDRQRLRDERRRAAVRRRRSRALVVLQHGDAGLRRQVPRLVETALPARDPPQLRIPRHVSDGHVVAARADDPAGGRDRHPGTPLPAALDAQPRAVSGIDHLREHPHADDRRRAQAARRAHPHLGRGSQLGFGARPVDAEGEGQEEHDADPRVRRQRDGRRRDARARHVGRRARAAERHRQLQERIRQQVDVRARVHLHDLAREPDADRRGASRLPALRLRLREGRAPASRRTATPPSRKCGRSCLQARPRKTRTS